MATNNSINSIFSNNSDGFLIGGGLPSIRTLSIQGGDVSFTAIADVSYTLLGSGGTLAVSNGTLIQGSTPFININGLLDEDNANYKWDDTTKELHTGDAIKLNETITPSAETNFGKVYTKADNKLYFQDGAGVEHEIAFV